MTTDAELLQAWRDGDKRAGNELIRRHFAALYRFFRNKVDAGADELIQRTMLACVGARDQFRGDASLRTYLFTIARNELYRYLREQRGHADEDFSISSMKDLGASPSAVVAKRQRDKIVLLALRRLPLELQIVVELHYWEEMRAADIATVLDIPLGTAKTKLARAKEKLRTLIPEALESPEAVATTVERLDTWVASLRAQIEDREDS